MADDQSTQIFQAWQRRLWMGVAGALGLMVLLLLLFVGSTVSRVVDILAGKSGDLAFTFAGMGLVALTQLRLLAILIGAGMVFGGLAVSFFVHAQAHRVNAGTDKDAGGLKASFATNSPGIAAIVVGAVVIISALFARGTHDYKGPAVIPIGEFDEGPGNAAPGAGNSPSSAQPSAAAASRAYPSASDVLGEPHPGGKR